MLELVDAQPEQAMEYELLLLVPVLVSSAPARQQEERTQSKQSVGRRLLYNREELSA